MKIKNNHHYQDKDHINIIYDNNGIIEDTCFRVVNSLNQDVNPDEIFDYLNRKDADGIQTFGASPIAEAHQILIIACQDQIVGMQEPCFAAR